MLLQGPNQRWSLDFLSDAFADGRRFRILAIVDDFTRECLALVADTSLPGLRVARELDAVIARRDRPAMIVSDNGTELTSLSMLVTGARHRVALHSARKAGTKCLRRELQRPAAGRMPQRDAVHVPCPCPRSTGNLDGRLQSCFITPTCLCDWRRGFADHAMPWGDLGSASRDERRAEPPVRRALIGGRSMDHPAEDDPLRSRPLRRRA
jgi:hypothetical protein